LKISNKLSSDERALVAHCLISSLETNQAEKRYAELLSGEVEPVSWEEVKKEVKGQDAKTNIPPGNIVRNQSSLSLAS